MHNTAIKSGAIRKSIRQIYSGISQVLSGKAELCGFIRTFAVSSHETGVNKCCKALFSKPGLENYTEVDSPNLCKRI
jgi:hypothetical protein